MVAIKTRLLFFLLLVHPANDSTGSTWPIIPQVAENLTVWSTYIQEGSMHNNLINEERANVSRPPTGTKGVRSPKSVSRGMILYGAPVLAALVLKKCGNIASDDVIKHVWFSSGSVPIGIGIGRQPGTFVSTVHDMVSLSATLCLGYIKCCYRCILEAFGIIMPAWVVVCVSVERFIDTWFPHKAVRVGTRRSALMVMTTTTVSVFVYGLWVSASTSLRNGKRGDASSTAAAIKLTRKKGAAALNSSRTQARKATKVVLTIVAVCILLTIPGAVFFRIRPELKKEARGSLPEYLNTLSGACFLGFMANNALNFFLYVLVSSNFRGVFLKMIKNKVRCMFIADQVGVETELVPTSSYPTSASPTHV